MIHCHWFLECYIFLMAKTIYTVTVYASAARLFTRPPDTEVSSLILTEVSGSSVHGHRAQWYREAMYTAGKQNNHYCFAVFVAFLPCGALYNVTPLVASLYYGSPLRSLATRRSLGCFNAINGDRVHRFAILVWTVAVYTVTSIFNTHVTLW